MWRDVFLNNREAVLEMLGRFQTDLARLTRAVEEGDGPDPVRHLQPYPPIRRAIIEIGQDTAAPNFGRKS